MPHFRKPRPRRSTPPGEHRPVLLEEVLTALRPQPGECMVDATLGFAGHAVEILGRLGPTGRLIGLDWDPHNLPTAQARLAAMGLPHWVKACNFAGLQGVLAEAGQYQVNGLLADLGVSSMQIDDAQRGFSYAREGPLDMRMDPTRGRTAADLLMTMAEADLATSLYELADEPEADKIAAAIVRARTQQPIQTTFDLARIVGAAVGQPVDKGRGWRLRPRPGQWQRHPAALTFQALRIMVNRELANLEHLLRVLPSVLAPGGRAVIISFHSGEDRLVKAAFKEGQRSGIYAAIAEDPLRASDAERQSNPRSRSAKLRWAVRSAVTDQPLA